MSTSWLTNEKKSVFKCSSFHFLGLLIVISYATAIEYGAYRRDVAFEGPGGHRKTTTTRIILEQLNHRNLTRDPDLQDATEHLLQYGALLRVQILDTFGKLVYDKYDDFGLSQIESLYRIYHDTLERKYNIFEIVPSVLHDGDTRPTKICQHINRYVHTCLKESSYQCAKINIHDEPHEDHERHAALRITRKLYRLAQIPKYYPEGFSLHAVLHHLRAGRLHLTPALFSGLLHNVQYDSFDDKVRRSERELVKYLNTAPNTWKIPKQSLVVSTKVSELLKSYLTAGAKLFPRKAAKQAAYLSKHVVREIDAVSKNIELLGIVYDNSTINLEYLFNLVLPKDVIDQDVLEARDYLVRTVKSKRIVERYLSIDKYQQNSPDQLLLDILGQLREIRFAEDLVASLYIHASYWHKSNMIENLEDLLELFDAYENLRSVKNHRRIFQIADDLKRHLRRAKNVSIEISCTRPRECLRLGLQTLLNCVVIDQHTRHAIQSFIQVTTWGCFLQTRKHVNETVREVVDLGSREASESAESFEIIAPATTTESVKKVVWEYNESEASSEQVRDDSQSRSEEWSASLEEITQRPKTTTPEPYLQEIIEKSIEEVVNKTKADRCRHNSRKCTETLCLNGICESNKMRENSLEMEEIVEHESEPSLEESASESHEIVDQAEQSEEESVEILEIPSTTKRVEVTTPRPIPTTTELQRTTRKAKYVICDNNDPHHQRKLHRLRRVRLIDALRSKPPSNRNVLDESLVAEGSRNILLPKRPGPRRISQGRNSLVRKSVIEGSEETRSPRDGVPSRKVVDRSDAIKGPRDILLAKHPRRTSQRTNPFSSTSVVEDSEAVRSLREKDGKTKLRVKGTEQTRLGASSNRKVLEKMLVEERTKLTSSATSDLDRAGVIRGSRHVIGAPKYPPHSPGGSRRRDAILTTSVVEEDPEGTRPHSSNGAKSKLEELEEIELRRKIIRDARSELADLRQTSFGRKIDERTKSRMEELVKTISRMSGWLRSHETHSSDSTNSLFPHSSASPKAPKNSRTTSVRKTSWTTADSESRDPNVARFEEILTRNGGSKKTTRATDQPSLAEEKWTITGYGKKHFARKPSVAYDTEEPASLGSKRSKFWRQEHVSWSDEPTDGRPANISWEIENPSKSTSGKNRTTKEKHSLWSSGPNARKVVRSRHRVSYSADSPSADELHQRAEILQHSKKTSSGIEDFEGGNSRRVYYEQFGPKIGRKAGPRSSSNSDVPRDADEPYAGGNSRRVYYEQFGPKIGRKADPRRSLSSDVPRDTDEPYAGNEMRRQHWKRTSYGTEEFGGAISGRIRVKGHSVSKAHRNSPKTSVPHEDLLQSGKEGQKFRREEHTIWSSGPMLKKTVESSHSILHGSDDSLGKTFETTNPGGGFHHSKISSYALKDFGGEGSSGNVKQLVRSRTHYSHDSNEPPALQGKHVEAASGGDFSALRGHETVHESRRQIEIAGGSGMTGGLRTTRTRSRTSYRGSSRSGDEVNAVDPSRSLFHETIVERPNSRKIPR